MSIIKSNKSWFRQLSYDIVQAHGGDLSVESKEGEGSEFSINLSIH